MAFIRKAHTTSISHGSGVAAGRGRAGAAPGREGWAGIDRQHEISRRSVSLKNVETRVLLPQIATWGESSDWQRPPALSARVTGAVLCSSPSPSPTLSPSRHPADPGANLANATAGSRGGGRRGGCLSNTKRKENRNHEPDDE